MIYPSKLLRAMVLYVIIYSKAHWVILIFIMRFYTAPFDIIIISKIYSNIFNDSNDNKYYYRDIATN